MKINFKRFLSFVLAFVMVFGLFPANVFATGEETTEEFVDELIIDESGDDAAPSEEEEIAPVADSNVAKVGNTEYATIDEAIANWGNNTTLTLLADVTLPDVVKLKSTEHHILDLGTYTMTAASGKNAIEITCEGRTSASYAITVNADAENPGGITAKGKSCIYYKKSGTTKDRPIILINNGVFNGSYSINSISNGNTNCPQIWIYGGTFNGNVNLTKNMLRVFGGTFNGWINCTGDSSAYREISGGTFKSWQFMTADADNKFWVGTSKANYNVGTYVDDNGYLVVGGPVVTEPGETFEASTANYGGWSNYLQYSSAKDNGLYYTDVETALKKNTSATVTVYADEVDMTGINFKGTIVVPEDSSVTITNAPANLKVTNEAGETLTLNANGSYSTIVPTGTITFGFTSETGVWGEGGGNAYESLVVELYKDETKIASASLNNIDGIIDGDVYVTWNIPFAGSNDAYWNVEWAKGHPNKNDVPTTVKMVIDGTVVAQNVVQMNGPDDLNKVEWDKLEALQPDVAMINGKGYKSLQAALNAAYEMGGEVTVTLLDNITEDVTVTEKVGLYLTIDGKGKTVDGSITIKALSDTNDNRRTTIQNVNFVNKGDSKVDFISSVETNHYPRITVIGCDFKGNGQAEDVAIRLKSSYGAEIKSCFATGLHSFLQNTSGHDLTIEKVSVSDSKSGLALGTVQGVTVNNCKITVKEYGVRMDAQHNNNAVISNNTVEAFIPVVVRKAEANSTITVSGANNMKATNEDGLWLAIGTSEYEENHKMPTDSTGKVVVTLNDTGVDKKGVYGNYFFVATIGDAEYKTLAEAIAAAKTGDTITFADNITESVTISKSVTIDGAGKTYTGTMKLTGACTVTIENVNFVKGSIDANTSASSRKLTIKGCNFDGVDKSIGYAMTVRHGKSVVIENSTAKNYSYGMLYVPQNVESITVKNVVVENVAAAFNLSYSGNDTFENVTLNNVTYGMHVQNHGARTITLKGWDASGCTNPVYVQEKGTATVTFKFDGVNTIPVLPTSQYAKIVAEAENGTMIGSLVGVVAAAKSGDTVKVLKDATGEVQISENAELKLDLNGKTLNGYIKPFNGKLTVENGSIVNTNKSVSGIEITAGELVLNNVNITSARHAVRVEGAATVTIDGGVYKVEPIAKGTYHAVNVGGAGGEKVTIKDGTFIGPKGTVADSGAAVNIRANAEVTIEGGNFSGGKLKTLGNAGKLTVTGGTFDQNPADYLPEDYCVKVDNGSYEVGKKDYKSVYTAPTLDADGYTTYTCQHCGHTYVVTDEGSMVKTVAKIGEQKFASLAEAIAAAQDGETVTILAGEYTTTLNVNKAITVEGEGNVIIKGKLSITADGATVKKLTVKNSGTACYIGAKNVLVEGCNLSGSNGLYQSYTSGTVTFKDSTITGSTYGVHFDGSAGGEIVIDNCVITGWTSFASSIKKVTMTNTKFAEGNYNYVRFYQEEAVIEGCTFNEKMAVDLAVSGAKLTVTNSTVENGNVEDLFSGADIVNSTITVNGEKLVRVAKIGGTYYKTLQAAIDAAQNGETVTLLADSNENVTVVQAPDKSITIDGNSKVYSGTITIHGNARHNGAETLTIQNFKFETSEAGHYFIDSNSTGSVERYAHNVTVKKSSFIATGAAEHSAAAMRIRQGYNISIESVTAKGMHSVLQAYGNAGVSVDGLIATNMKNGISVGTSTGVKIERANIAATGYGVRADGTGAYDLTVQNSDIKAKDPVVVRNATKDGYRVTVEGSTLNGTNAGGYGVIFTAKDDGTYVEPTVGIQLNGASEQNVFPVFKAKIGNVGYASFAAAYAAAQAGETIELLADVEATEVILIDKSLTINGNDHKVTSSASRVFRITTSNVEVTLNDVNMVSKAVRVGTNDIRGISIDDVNNVKLTLNNCSVDFIDASACDWTYAVNVVGGANHTLTISGGTYEGANVINVRGANSTVTVENTTLTSLYPNNDVYYGSCIYVLSGKGTSVEATGNTFNGANAIAFNVGSGNPVTESNNADNTAMVVAKNGDDYYTSVAAAFAAAQNGDTIKLLQNVALSETVKVPAFKARTNGITLNLNGKTITGTDNATSSFALIELQPGAELTVTGNGAITLTATNNRGWSAYSSVISNQRGKLTVEGGTIEHLGGTDMAYGIDNLTNGKGTYAELVINGGTIKSTYRAIRQFLNGTEAQNILTVNGGTIEGANKSVWMQDANKSANPGKLTIGADATIKGDVYVTASAGSTEWPVELSVADAALKDGATVLTSNIPATYVVENNNGVWGVSNGLKGSGTEADPYQIGTLSELILFRNSVNAGETKYNAKGVWVALSADIDMAGENWNRGIGDGINATFDGCFDGKGHTIKNLNMTVTRDSDGYLCGGLFGYIYKSGVIIRNLTIENATIDCGDAAGHNVGVLVGFAMRCSDSLIENVTIKGDVKVDAPNAYGVGAIVGYTNYNGFEIKNCVVNANDGSYIKGYSFVGGIIGYGYTNTTITDCSVNNIDIIATSKSVGAVAGLLGAGSQITGATVNGVEVSGQANVGSVLGAIAGEGIIVESNGAEPVVGGSYVTSKPVEAKIGNKYYTTFAAAYAAANEGETVTLLAPIVVAAGEALTLNKNVTVTYTSNVPGEDMITNRGNLVIDGTTLVYTNTDTTASNVTVSTISTEAGSTLEVKSGIVKNESANNGAQGIYAYAIDILTNGSLGDVTATISGGEIISTNYMAIRQFNNGTACKNTLTVTGGKIYGEKRAIQIHMNNDAAYTTISGGEIKAGEGGYALCFFPTNATHIAVTGGTFTGAVYSGSNGFISGGTYGEELYEGYIAEGFIPVKNSDGTYGVKAGKYLVSNTTTGARYETLAAAIAAANTGDTITFLADITENVTINKSVTINGAGMTYTGTMTGNKGLTITIENVNFVNGGFDKPSGQNSTTGNYTIKNCTFVDDGNYDYPVRIYGANKLVVEDCTVKGYKYSFLYVVKSTNTVSVKNVTVENCPSYAVYFASGVNTATFENLTVKNSNTGFVINNTAGRKFTIKDCKMENVGTAIAHSKGTNAITCTAQGTNDFGTAVLSEYAKIVLAEDATLAAKSGLNVTTTVDNSIVVYENGVYKVVNDPAAQIGTQGFATLADAIAAANAGDVIELLKDITEDVTVSTAVTIDGAGKTYTGAMTLKADTTIKNVNFDGKGYNGYAITTRGANYLTIEDCTAVNYGYGFVQLASGTALTTVKNVTVSGMNYGVKVDYSNAVVLENVDITVGVAAVLNSNYGEKTITIKNSKLNILGTWVRNNTTKTTYVFEGANSIAKFITDDNLDNFVLAAKDATLTAPEGINVVSGVEDYKVKYEEGTYKLVKAAIAKIGNVEYSSLQEAVDAAKAGATIKLIADAEGPGVVIDKNLTIDFAGHTYSLTVPVGSTGTESNGFQILAGNTVTLRNGTLKVADSAADKFYILIQNYADLKLNSITLDGRNLDKYAFTDGDSYVLSNNSGNSSAIATKIIVNDNGDKAVAFDVCKFGNYTEPTMNIKVADAIYVDETTLAVDYAKYVEAAAFRGNYHYATLQQAVDLGGTVTLLKDIAGPGVVIRNDVNINFANHTYTITEPVGSTGTESNGFQILKGTVVVFRNGTLKVADSVANKFYILVQNYSDSLSMSSMTLDGTNLDKYAFTDGDSYTLSNNSGNVNIGTGTKIIANNDGALAFAFDACDQTDKGYDLPVVTVHTRATIEGNIEAAAKIGNVYYANLQQAIDAAGNGKTITMMSNIKVDTADAVKTASGQTVMFNIEGKSLTLDMNGKTIDVAYDSSELMYAVVCVADGASLTVKGEGAINLTTGDTLAGEYDCVAYMFWKRGTTGELNIENGTFTANKLEDSMVYTNGDKIVSVKGGTWTLGNVATGSNNSPWIFNTAGQNARTILVSGGTYNFNVAKQHYALEVSIVDAKGNLSYVVDNGDGTWTVTGETAEAGIVTGTWNATYLYGYATFKDAVNSIAKGAPETTIVLMKDINVKGQFIGYNYPMQVVVDLNGYKMSSTDRVMTVYRPGTVLTLKNGTVYGNTTAGGINVANKGKLVLGENVSITSSNAASALRVEPGATLVIDQPTSYVLGGKNDLIVADGANVQISAGYFKHPVNADWCAEGLVPTGLLENGYYSVTEDPSIGMAAQIGNEYFETIQAAVNAAENGAVITVLADHELVWDGETFIDGSLAAMVVVAGKSVTIDLNGKKLTVDANKMNGTDLYAVFAADEGGKLTLTGDGTVTATGAGFKSGVTAYCLMMAYEEGTELIVLNGTYTMESAYDSLVYTGSDECVTIKGGTFNLGNQGTGDNGKPWIFNGYGKNANEILVRGGTFNADVNHQFWANEVDVLETLALKNNGNGTWTVVEAAAYVEEIGRSQHSRVRKVGYATVAEAYAAAKNGQQVTILNNGEAVQPEIVETNDVSTLVTNLANGGNVSMTESMTVSTNQTGASNGYGKTGVVVNGGSFNGNGETLTVTNANATWDSALTVKSGSVQNVTITGAFRGIFMGGANGDVYINNVVLDGVTYTFNSDGGSKNYGVYISNTTLKGWTSFSNVHKEVVFTDCTFGKGNGQAFCRPYNDVTVFTNCVFEEGFKFDTAKISGIVFENCYYGETLITADNASEIAMFYNGLNGAVIK